MRMQMILMLLLSVPPARSQSLGITACQLQINVTDMGRALNFYVDKLRFHIKASSNDSGTVSIADYSGENVLILHQVRKLVPVRRLSIGPCLTLQVNDLDSSIRAYSKMGISFKKSIKHEEAVGYAIDCEDPFGLPISLMQQTIIATPYFNEPRVYNFGLQVKSMDAARSFYKGLGFVERSTKYLPGDMPLGFPDGRFAFMLHTRIRMKAIPTKDRNQQHLIVLFKVGKLSEVQTGIARFIPSTEPTILIDGLGRYIPFTDNSGIACKMIEAREEE
jgi:predicted enzyme related to lactoylglutathione lyase